MFLSARPERGATAHRKARQAAKEFLSARPERGATRGRGNIQHVGSCFYPHAPSGARPLI